MNLFDAFIQEFLDSSSDVPSRPVDVSVLDAFLRETRMKPL